MAMSRARHRVAAPNLGSQPDSGPDPAPDIRREACTDGIERRVDLGVRQRPIGRPEREPDRQALLGRLERGATVDVEQGQASRGSRPARRPDRGERPRRRAVLGDDDREIALGGRGRRGGGAWTRPGADRPTVRQRRARRRRGGCHGAPIPRPWSGAARRRSRRARRSPRGAPGPWQNGRDAGAVHRRGPHTSGRRSRACGRAAR